MNIESNKSARSESAQSDGANNSPHFFSRSLASCLDISILWLILVLLRVTIVISTKTLHQHGHSFDIDQLVGTHLFLIVIFVYFLWFEISDTCKGSPGKWLMKQIVVDRQGQVIGIGQCLARTFLRLIFVYLAYTGLDTVTKSGSGFFLFRFSLEQRFFICLGLSLTFLYLISSISFGNNNQSWFNQICGCRVVNHPSKGSVHWCVYLSTIIVLPILLSIIYLSVLPLRDCSSGKSYKRRCFANQKTMLGAIEMWQLDTGDKRVFKTVTDFQLLIEQKYLQTLPHDPGQSKTEQNYRHDEVGNVWCKYHGHFEEKCMPSKTNQCQTDTDKARK